MKSWKTTLWGVFGAFLMVAGPPVAAKLQGAEAPPITTGTLAPAAVIAVLGFLSKDHDVTGGDRR